MAARSAAGSTLVRQQRISSIMGCRIPPSYNISNIRNAPVSIFWAENDWLADPQDVHYIIKNLPTLKESFYIPKWDHLDFIWAMDAKPVVYDHIVKILSRTNY
ncbi:hypothetical protein EB796_004754 [Bugula neritina]|uniref:Uncharacterized protein n=1 Tax=Bugula neritina TaxID=10212 RepID=A0A7J7KFC5_BUGNE|nr:hypothetical protein EB796_004754 [Bugula neritina]